MDEDPNKMVTIYKLVDPRNNSVKYIGQTHKSLKKRLAEHLAEARRGSKNHRCNWIRKLLSKGLFPFIEVLEYVAYDDANEREKYWIAQCGREYLVNGTDGGEGTIGLIVSKETRIKQSLSHVGKPTWNKGISIPNTHLRDFQYKKGDIPYNKGIPWNIETKIKISNSKLGKSVGKKKTTKGLCFGVTYFRDDAVWISQITFMREKYFIGRYKTEKDAGIAYDICSLWFSMEDRKLNFPNKREEYMTLLLSNNIESLKKLRKMIRKHLENGGKIL